MSPKRVHQSRIAGLDGGICAFGGPEKQRARANATTALARTLDTFCESVLWSGGAPPSGAPGRGVPLVEGPRGALRGLVSVLVSSDSDRVLFVGRGDAPVELDRLLALIAYPRHDLVWLRPRDGEPVDFALCARESVLPVAQERLAEGHVELESIFGSLDNAVLDDLSG